MGNPSQDHIEYMEDQEPYTWKDYAVMAGIIAMLLFILCMFIYGFYILLQ